MSDPVVAEQLRCPACAAPVEAPPGDVLRCPYCGTKSRLGRSAAPRAAATTSAPRPASTGAPLLVVGLVVLALGLGAYFLLLRSESVSSVGSPAIAQPVATPVRPTPMVAPSPAPAPAVAPEPARPDHDDMFSTKAADGAVEVRWTAKVKKASGRSKAGAKCEIVGHTDGDSVRPLAVRCKGDLLYSSTQKFSGMANMSTGATVVTDKGGSPRWHLRYNDTGSRSMRAQIRLDSAARIGRIWSDELPAWEVELAIDPEGSPVTKSAPP